MSCAARNAAMSVPEATGSATTGWPTKSQPMPAACIKGGSNGNRASTWSMTFAILVARPSRQAQTDGAT